MQSFFHRTNGLSVSEQTLAYINNRIKILPRPLILHFVQILSVVKGGGKEFAFGFGITATGAGGVDDIDLNTYARPPPAPLPKSRGAGDHNSGVDGSIRDSTL